MSTKNPISLSVIGNDSYHDSIHINNIMSLNLYCIHCVIQIIGYIIFY